MIVAIVSWVAYVDGHGGPWPLGYGESWGARPPRRDGFILSNMSSGWRGR